MAFLGFLEVSIDKVVRFLLGEAILILLPIIDDELSRKDSLTYFEEI